MKFKNKKLWRKAERNNRDDYGQAIIRYAQRWAELMEAELKSGKKLAEIAKKAGFEADTELISGSQWGCAVNLLVATWKFGNELDKIIQ